MSRDLRDPGSCQTVLTSDPVNLEFCFVFATAHVWYPEKRGWLETVHAGELSRGGGRSLSCVYLFIHLLLFFIQTRHFELIFAFVPVCFCFCTLNCTFCLINLVMMMMMNGRQYSSQHLTYE